MEGFLFLVDMVLLILLLIAVDKAEKTGKQYIDSGIFGFYREPEDELTKRGNRKNA